FEVGARGGIEFPAFGTVLAGGGGAVEGTFALAAVEAGEGAAAEGDPEDAVTVDVHTTRGEAGDGRLRVIPRHFVIFGEGGFGRVLAGIEADEATGEAED